MTNTSSANLFASLSQGSAEPVNGPQTQQLAGNNPTEVILDETDEPDAPVVNELDMLKSRARLMGITFSNNIKVEKLREKIEAKLSDEADDSTEESDGNEEDDESELTSEVTQAHPGVGASPVPASSGSSLLAQIATMSTEEKAAILHLLGGSAVQPAPAAPVLRGSSASNKASQELAMRKEIMEREMALIRVRIQNLDPKKANLPGEILTVANEYLGTVSKFIPYGEATDDGYHVPVCLLNQLKERTFLQIKTVKNANGRGTTTKTADVREFAIEILPPLTETDLAKLAAAQAAAAGN